ncbi:MAG: helix-turn-helix transcriptional regulator [Oscillospiraceae bacterium]|nr:helix-turn-helix transcriptional regulator [Oscillospiraceae bacterium]
MPHFLGTILRELREEKHETQDQVGKEIGVSRELVKAWERESWEKDARQVAKIEQYEALASHFNVSVDYLLGRTKIKRPDASLKSAAEYTHLSEKALLNLHHLGEIESSTDMAILSELISSPGFYDAFSEIASYLRKASQGLTEIKKTNDLLSEADQDPDGNMKLKKLKSSKSRLYSYYKELRLSRFEALESFTDAFDFVTQHKEKEEAFETALERIGDVLLATIFDGEPVEVEKGSRME